MYKTLKALAIITTIVLTGSVGLYFSDPTTNQEVHEEVPLVDVVINTEQEKIIPDETIADVEPENIPEKKVPDTTNNETGTTEVTPIPTEDIPMVPVQQPELTTEEVAQPELLPQFSSINEQTRAAILNILCTTSASGVLKPITGSGIIIDSRGVILTNSHIAQYFLLKDYPSPGNVDCVIRTGSPARNMYKAELIYMPTQWILDNKTSIRVSNPTGTGENDYALLRITGTTDETELPTALPFIPTDLSSSHVEEGDEILIVSYPAGLLGGETIIKNLYIASANSEVFKIFTFSNSTPDLISTGGTVVAQKGSSGGAVVSYAGGLQAIIVTSSDGATTGERDLRAITMSHIERSMQKFSGFGIENLLSGDIAIQANVFNQTVAPTLTNILVNELQKVTAP